MVTAELLSIERIEMHFFFPWIMHLFWVAVVFGEGAANGNYEEALKPWVFTTFFLSLPFLPAVDLTTLPWAGDVPQSQMLHLWLILRQHKEDCYIRSNCLFAGSTMICSHISLGVPGPCCAQVKEMLPM